MRRILTSVLLALAATLFFAAPVAAQDDDDGYNENPVVDSEVNEDGSVTVTGENCPPNSTGTYEVRRGSRQGQGPVVDSGTFQTDDEGRFQFRTKPLPDGRYTIAVTCGGETTVLSVVIGNGAAPGGPRPRPAVDARGGSLATTGTDSAEPLARLGVLLVAAGGLAVYAAKKRTGRRA